MTAPQQRPGRHAGPKQPDRDCRGQSVSLLVILIMAAMIFTAGLVIDGGQKVAGTTRAEAAAAAAARAASNAAAARELGGNDPASAAVTAGRAFLAGQPDVSGSVSITAGIVQVRTTTSSPTIFLSVIGIDRVTSTGSAQTNIVPTGQNR